MLTNFGNDKMSDLLKGMILFNDIPEPILSKFFARAYTLESPFYDIMNKSLMEKDYDIYSTYIKLLYKGIVNKSYEPKTDCTLYRGTKLEKFEIEKLKDILKKNREFKDIPIIYSTSFLSFSNDDEISKGLGSRRLSTSKNRSVIIKLNPLNYFDKGKIMETNGCLYEISFYHDENEVLFFPFSSFELVDVKEYDDDMTLIEFNYSLRFKKKIDGCVGNDCCII